ncbi:uncharacterized protein B0H64DRAFT_419674 [Chaetomium fimeti]|uniref:Uncharacterized protein n=1 Tax=Chaetomium fimeti TaxID=1854472 RepID=A0AAE0H9N8_9PEZI|nr:hypothetical protein B0H64DRAFT_419674 [Chaetomium fimeti]
MARLAQSPRIHQWFGKYLLKGFSTAIVPSQRLDDAILWHLYYSDDGESDDGERLPYPDTGTIQCADVEADEIAKGRHILGWCSEAQFYAGSKDANYAIRESRLSSPGKDFSLEKVSFSVGQIVTGGCQFSIGRKDTPIRITRGGYVDKLRWIRQRYFTLYDVDDNRGFLIDGASTLLHLLRTSLHLSSVDEFASELLFEHSKFQESPDPLKRSSAVKVLLSETNRRLPLYREDEHTSTTVQHRIEQLYETLEKLVDHAHHAEATHKGVHAKPRISNHLKGWDFTDLASDRDPFHLKVAKLPLSVNWVDFTRAIPAVTLFGRGFGELIRPAAHPHPQQLQQACLDWMALPTDQYHLCVGAADLTAIVQRIVGSDTSTTSNNNALLTIAPGVVCHNPGGDTFSRCACERTKTPTTAATRSVFKETAGIHPVLELTSEGELSINRIFGVGTDGSGAEIDLAAHPDGAVILGTPKRRWPWQQNPPPALSLGAVDEVNDRSSLQGASPGGSASSSSSSSTSELDSASGSGSGFGTVTPLTSVASGESGAGDADLVGGGLGPVGSGTKRRGWCSSEDGSEGDGFGRVEGSKRRKMLSKMRETTKDIGAFLKGTPGRDGDVGMVGDVEMDEG